MRKVRLTESQLQRVIAESVRRCIKEGWNEEMFDKMNNAQTDWNDNAGRARINRAKDYLAHRYLRDNNLSQDDYTYHRKNNDWTPTTYGGGDYIPNDIPYSDEQFVPMNDNNLSSKQLKALNTKYKKKDGSFGDRSNLMKHALSYGSRFERTPDAPKRQNPQPQQPQQPQQSESWWGRTKRKMGF